jgi:glycosyltransferase involved in cell wall biosynthesis
LPKISVIIPCYFNEGNIPVTFKALLASERAFSPETSFEYIFVDDASKDGTLTELHQIRQTDPQRVKIIVLSENVGSYAAICAGFEYATGDCLVVISADLQDPPEIMVEMYTNWSQGYPVILAVRQRRNDPMFTKLAASTFHGLLRMSGLKSLPNGGFDYCLFDRSLVPEILKRHSCGVNTLLLLLTLEKKVAQIPYERRKREIGRSRWSFGKRLRLAVLTWLYFVVGYRRSPNRCYHIDHVIGFNQ